MIIKQQKISVICSVDVLIFLRYTPSKRSVLLIYNIINDMAEVLNAYDRKYIS